MVTVEFTSPAPRLCPSGQPCIGATATDSSVRGQGIGRALVHAVLNWAHLGGYETVSVDFEPSNRLSRAFRLGLGFEPAGYRARRGLDPAYTSIRDGR